MNDKKDEKKELISLNENLYDEFYIEELESRLETDPLAIGGILELFSSNESLSPTDWCVGKSNCSENTGTSCGIHLDCDCVIKFW